MTHPCPVQFHHSNCTPEDAAIICGWRGRIINGTFNQEFNLGQRGVTPATTAHERTMRIPLARPAWSWRRICETRIKLALSQVSYAEHPWIGAVY